MLLFPFLSFCVIKWWVHEHWTIQTGYTEFMVKWTNWNNNQKSINIVVFLSFCFFIFPKQGKSKWKARFRVLFLFLFQWCQQESFSVLVWFVRYSRSHCQFHLSIKEIKNLFVNSVLCSFVKRNAHKQCAIVWKSFASVFRGMNKARHSQYDVLSQVKRLLPKIK